MNGKRHRTKKYVHKTRCTRFHIHLHTYIYKTLTSVIFLYGGYIKK